MLNTNFRINVISTFEDICLLLCSLAHDIIILSCYISRYSLLNIHLYIRRTSFIRSLRRRFCYIWKIFIWKKKFISVHDMLVFVYRFKVHFHDFRPFGFFVVVVALLRNVIRSIFVSFETNWQTKCCTCVRASIKVLESGKPIDVKSLSSVFYGRWFIFTQRIFT